jgi:ribosome biogenesis GTPase A
MATIQWFPGHMAKARREVETILPLIDIVYELRDARIPFASSNPLIEEITSGKPRLVVLNKADLADERLTQRAIEQLRQKGITAISVNSLTGNPLAQVMTQTRVLLQSLVEKEAQRGMKPRPFRGLVLGIPNVGKSQFINRLAKKVKAKTGDRPGITKMQTYLRAGKDLELIDNPGILWPRFDDLQVGKLLALVGSIKDEVYPKDEVVGFGIAFLLEHYPDRLQARYRLEQADLTDYETMINAIARNRGCILRQGEIDHDRVMGLILHDFRNQMFGNISYEGHKIHGPI